MYTISALFTFTLLYALYVINKRLRSPVAQLPGSFISKLTSLPLKYNEFTGNRRIFVHNLHMKYGATVRLAPNEVSYTNLEAIKEIYSSGGSGYDKTEFYDLFRQYGRRTMFSTLVKDEHAQRKRILADRYAMTNIVRDDVVNGIQHHSNKVIEVCSMSKGASIDVYVLLHCYALDCASHHLLGEPGATKSLYTEEDGLELMQELSYDSSLKMRFLEYYSPRLAGKLSSIFPTRYAPKTTSYVLRKSQQTDPAEHCLLAKMQQKKSQLETIQMAAEIMDHLAAGIDTTGDGLCFLLYQLSQPDTWHVQDKLRVEFERNPDAALDELPYLEAVIKEGLRCFPPIPMSFPRYVPEGGRCLNGFDVPAGTIVSCQPYSVHLLNENTFPQPHSFLPERWLEDEGQLDRNRLFFSFATGGRGCVGKNLAMVEMKMLVRAIYSAFTTRIADDMDGSMEMDDQIISTRPKGQKCLLVFNPLSTP